MCEALEELFASRLEAREQKGLEEGISRLSTLIGKLLDSNRIADIKRVTEDPGYRESLFSEFHL